MSQKINIINNIRTLRFFAGEMTQQQLAEKVGASRQTIIAIESGKYSPSLEMAYSIAHALGVNLEKAFEFKVCQDKKDSQK